LPLSPFGAAGAATFELTLHPLQQGKRSGSELYYSVVKVHFLCFQLHCVTKIQNEIFQELARLSPLPPEFWNEMEKQKASRFGRLWLLGGYTN
jgi:hypothetical protein